MRIESLLLLHLSCHYSLAFVILPYVQIDFAHYFRLAQCQAKCSQKYAILYERVLNDGSVMDAFNSSSEEMHQCQIGCEHHRRLGGNRARSLTNARQDGVKFWQESSPSTERATPTSPVARVSLLCQNAAAVDKGELTDSAEGLIGLDMKRHAGHVRGMVQWRQRTVINGVAQEEGPAITASIESEPLFKVEGMLPGVQYRFIMTMIGPNGQLGESVSSEWFEGISAEKAPEGSAHIRSGYNTEDGATALLSWSRAHIDSCYYTVTVANSTYTKKDVITVDTSGAVLLRNLEMDARYDVTIAARSADAQSHDFPRPLLLTFTTITCKEVHGKNSINCPPDPVNELVVNIRPNGTAEISWAPSAPSSQVLTYEVLAQPIPPCTSSPIHIFLNAASTTAAIYLGDKRPCEFTIRVTNYDLVGRESARETRVVLTPPVSLLEANWDTLLAGALSLAVLGFVLLLLKFAHSCAKRARESKENKKQLVGYV